MIHNEIEATEDVVSQPKARVLSVSGVDDEAWFVAQEIARLHDEEKIPFENMAVISRHKERLLQSKPTQLQDRFIPYHSSTPELLGRHPGVAELLSRLREGVTAINSKEKRSWTAWTEWAIGLAEEKMATCPIL